ncbi:MAG: AI-2E family transporter [Sulfurifustaceae bacterium]
MKATPVRLETSNRVKAVGEKEIRIVPIPFAYHVVSWVLMGIALVAILTLKLVAALLAGLLVYYIVHALAGAVRIPYFTNRHVKLAAVALLAILVVAALTLAGIGAGVFLRRGPENLSAMFTQMALIVHDLRHILPDGVVAYLPPDADGIKELIASWFHQHAARIRTIGTDTLHALVHVLIGLIIGAMVALHKATPHAQSSPFVRALSVRAERLANAFRNIMLAQVPISAINTMLTAIYLVVVLPSLGIHLPFAKTLIAITFIAGLLPVVGNLISNTAIFLVSLGHSFALAAASLGYLIVIHKLEYFLNARIVGGRINAKAWELLIAMVFLETAFGVQGLIAAPLLYAYAKYELGEEGIV